jgi:hypothetical protein
MTDRQVAQIGRLPDCSQSIYLPRAFLFTLLTLLFAPIAAVVLGLVSYIVWWAFVPWHAADLHIKELDTTITLQFYLTSGGSGRYLTVKTPYGETRQNICGFNWAHWSRTSIYLTEDRRIAVLGVDHCDYVVSINPMEMTEARNIPSENWTYLGAFRLADYPKHDAPDAFRFIPASEQTECIEEATEGPPPPWTPRNHARQPRCH